MLMGMMKASKPNATEVGHVHLQARQKHDVINTYLAKKLKTAVAHQDVEPMLTDGQSG